MTDLHDLLPDFGKGPLDEARGRASFCWRKMRIFIEEENLLRYKTRVWRNMEMDPLFAHSPLTQSVDELRRVTAARVNRLRDHDYLSPDEIAEDPRKMVVLLEAINSYDANAMLRFSVPFQFFPSSIRGLGTSKHQHILEQADNREISGCFCMTEISHGTNTKQLRTTATFDPATQQFILHTPDFEAAKCWAGSLGHTATHASVFAQLVTPDGQSHGLHAFYCQIRDMKTLRTLPGVIAGDMGEKLGLNAVDNGFMMFNNFRIPKDSLLDKTGSVTQEGNYATPFKSSSKRFGASLGSLLGGRMGINTLCWTNLAKAVVIAVRYSAVRRQFGPADSQQELPVISYQLQQWRLIPYLATAYVLSAFARRAVKEYIDFTIGLMMGEDPDRLNDVGIEMHALMSSAKPLSSWLAQHGIQDCREACGGHGYLKAAGFGGLRDDNDANCTYEGANDVLLQQTSNWLLGIWSEKRRVNGKCSVQFSSPLGSVQFLHDVERASSATFRANSVEDLMHPAMVMEMYEWLLCHLLTTTEAHHKAQLKLGKDQFTAKNDIQVFHARTLALAYIEYYCIKCFWERMNSEDVELSLKPVLTKMCSLFGLWRIENHLASLYEGGFSSGPKLSKLVRSAVVQLSSELAKDAVPLADALAPPDFVLNSVLGVSNGEVYKAIQSTFYQNPGVFERPEWWREILPKASKL